MKKVYLIIIFIYSFFAVPSLNAGILDEVSSVSEKSDIYMYINMQNLISFLKQKGINIKDLDELAADNSGKDDKKALTDFGIKLSDIREVFFAGYTEDFEKKGGFIVFVTVNDNKAKIPESAKLNSVKINGISFFEANTEAGILFSLLNNTFIAGPKEYIEAYFEKKKSKTKILSEAAKVFRKNSENKTIYLNLSVSDYLRNEMEKAYTQGALISRGLRENVFLKTLLNLKSVDYGIHLSDRTHIFAGMQGESETDSERLLMLSHFAIVGTSFAASFADIIAARSQDKALGKVTENNEVLTTVQQVIGRMKAKQVDNGVVVSFSMTERETDSLIAFVKKSLDEGKKARAERKESEKISAITKAINDKDTTTAERLLNDNTDVNIKDLDGNSILSSAALMGDMKIASIAISKNAYIELKNSEGLTPLHFAAKGGSTEMVRFLINKGADITAKNENDMTPLHYNAQQGNHEITRLLVTAGADLNALAMDGATPSHLACEEGYIDIIKIFAEKNAAFTIRDSNGERAVDVAARNGHAVLVEYFKTKFNLEPSPVQEEDIESDNNFDDEYNEEVH